MDLNILFIRHYKKVCRLKYCRISFFLYDVDGLYSSYNFKGLCDAVNSYSQVLDLKQSMLTLLLFVL